MLAGKGLCFETTCAWRPPVYTLFLTLTALVGKNYLLIVLPQAAMGAGTALCAFLIGRELFGSFTGILAGLITAFYPYYVMHDTALQDTGMFTLLTALSVFVLLRARNSDSKLLWALAGLLLGTTLLTRPVLAPVVPFILL